MAGRGPEYARGNRGSLSTKAVLASLVKDGLRTFSATDLAERHEIAVQDAARRIQYLQLWGCVRYYGPAKRKGKYGRPRQLYEVTDHGERCGRDWA